MIEAKNVGVTIAGTDIIKGVNFAAKAGEVCAIVGPNGCGKTTFMRALTGEVDYHGQVLFNDRDSKQIPAWQLALYRAVLPQATVLAFPFTVFEVVRLGLTAGAPHGQQNLVQEALIYVGLRGFEKRFYQELSGGEKQRVQLARILVQVWQPVLDGTPCWLYLDEPVSSLDIGHQIEVMAIARDFAQRGGGVITVMHDLNLTAMFADNIALFEKGHLMIQGTPDEVMQNHLLSKAYQWQLQVNQPPTNATPYILPQAAALQGIVS